MSSSSAASAVGGKAARACDSCLRRRARWYCPADDAFLCQACDASVHSANPLARRHERLRLRPAPSPPHVEASNKSRQAAAPAWSKRRARTRRPRHKSVGELLSRKLVGGAPPEVPSSNESSEERKADDKEEEEQLLYHRVPTFDRALAELCSPPPVVDDRENAVGAVENVSKDPVVARTSPVQQQLPDGLIAGFGSTDAELREFAADMEALLGQGLDDVSNELGGSFYMESLMPPPPPEDGGGRLKVESDSTVSHNSAAGAFGFGRAAEMKPEAASAEVLDIDFNNCCSPTAADDDDDNEEEDSLDQKATTMTSNGDAAADAQLFLRRSLDLRLSYEAVIESWGASPWTDGQRPQQVRLDDFWPHAAYHSGLWPEGGRPGGGGPSSILRPRCGTADGGREARVSRYREKRRTRLFAKKIRYEVRKLNAEKRPRMKGRFVKRPPAAAPCAAVAKPKKAASQRAGACPPVPRAGFAIAR